MKNLMQKIATGAVLSVVATTLACNGSAVSGPTAATTDARAEQATAVASSYRPAPMPTLAPAPTPGRLIGVIESIRGQQLVVAQRTVMTARATRIWLGKTRVTFESLQRGQQVEIDTTVRKDGTLLATTIEIQF